MGGSEVHPNQHPRHRPHRLLCHRYLLLWLLLRWPLRVQVTTQIADKPGPEPSGWSVWEHSEYLSPEYEWTSGHGEWGPRRIQYQNFADEELERRAQIERSWFLWTRRRLTRQQWLRSRRLRPSSTQTGLQLLPKKAANGRQRCHGRAQYAVRQTYLTIWSQFSENCNKR